MKFDLNRIRYTNRGFNFVEVSPFEVISWGGLCVCGFCNQVTVNNSMYLVYILHDTYCYKCFSDWLLRQNFYSIEDVEYDLLLQKEFSLSYYLKHLHR